jgi:hypothetical protein
VAKVITTAAAVGVFFERLASKVVSFTPGFSPVSDDRFQQKTVSTVFRAFAAETVNENDF